jgi:hypothetical protein
MEGNPVPAELLALEQVVGSASMRRQGDPRRFEVVDQLRATILVDVTTQLRGQGDTGILVVTRELRADGRIGLTITTDSLVKAGLALDQQLRAVTDPVVVDSMRAAGGGRVTVVDSMRTQGEGGTVLVDSMRTQGERSTVLVDSMRTQGEGGTVLVDSMRTQGEGGTVLVDSMRTQGEGGDGVLTLRE